MIARAGRPVAVLTSYRPERRRRKLGLFPGEASIHPDFDELPAELSALFGEP